jgi:ribosomal protein L11 methyltransferase
MNYIEVEFNLSPFNPWNEVLIAYLSEQDFESFQEEKPKVKAYIQEELFQKENFELILKELNSRKDLHFSYNLTLIPQQNWNSLWESQFEPVIIEDKLQIIAPFHRVNDFSGQIIVIEPKMSFGTGHHQTTYLMCKTMFDLDLKDQVVLDMGAGTGVLAILAEKLGALHVDAYDIEPWSVENCRENSEKNDCHNISSYLGDIDQVSGNFNLILANINKNVLKAHLPGYSNLLYSGGTLLLSGFFTSDENELKLAANENNLEFEYSQNREGWSMLKFIKL